MNPHEKWLRLMADEIRKEGHSGWGNTAEWAADEIRRLQNAWEAEVLANRPKGDAVAVGASGAQS